MGGADGQARQGRDKQDCTGASSPFIIKTDFTYVIPVNISLKQIVERTTMSA